MRLVLITFLSITLLIISSCSLNHKESENKTQLSNKTLLYAKKFIIKKGDNYTKIELLGDKNSSEATATFILYKNEKPNITENAFYVKTPVKKMASMSSIYTTMIEKLGDINSIVAIDNVDYYTNEKIQKRVKEKTIIELSKGPKVEIEKTIILNPDLFLSFGMGNPSTDIEQKIIQAKIPVAISIDHLEETPLARAEWIKFIACFFDKENLADSLFQITEKNYNTLKEKAKHIKTKPTVLTEIKYGEAWYVPSGNSYIANLINDAGGNYFWKDDKKTGSTPLTFETVYTKAKDCDMWINLYNINSKKELLSYDERYSLFKAFKENKIYNNNKVQNNLGFSNYWETGITNPDDILADLITIFTNDSLSSNEFKYYKKIE